jgi:hypothetical protein
MNVCTLYKMDLPTFRAHHLTCCSRVLFGYELYVSETNTLLIDKSVDSNVETLNYMYAYQLQIDGYDIFPIHSVSYKYDSLIHVGHRKLIISISIL